MDYLLVMSFSGCTMTVICLLLWCLLKDMVSARMYYLLARAAVVYYLVPMPFLKRWYGKIIRAVVPERQMEAARISLTWTSYTVHADGKMHINVYAVIQIAVVAVWLSVAGFLMARQLLAYLRTARRIAGYTRVKMTDRQKEFVDGLKKEYGIRRQVLLYQGEHSMSAMTFGVYRPVVICGRIVGSREAELQIRHELIHIRRLDALWKMFMQMVMFLHWWNPLMWVLYRELDRACELSCDETVMQGRSEEEVKEYLRLLILEAQDEGKTEKASLRWKAGFGDNKRKIKERMDNLMKKKRWNRFAAGTLVAALVFANSMTAFAYRDGLNEIIPEDMSQEQIERVLEDNIVLFTPEGSGEESTSEFDLLGEIEIQYDRQFTDEEGNIYPVPDIVPHWSCDHTYVAGTETRHKKNSDGSCEVTQYKAERCSQCGTIKLGDFISSHYYAVCPH